MKRHRTAFVAMFAFLVLSAGSADEAWVVRADGAGPIRIGMTLAQVNKALDENFTAPADKRTVSM